MCQTVLNSDTMYINYFCKLEIVPQRYKLILLYSFLESEDISIVERLFSSSLVAIVSLSSPRKLKVCHFKKGTEICNYSYSNTILAVRLNRLVRYGYHTTFLHLLLPLFAVVKR